MEIVPELLKKGKIKVLKWTNEWMNLFFYSPLKHHKGDKVLYNKKDRLKHV